MPNNEPHRIKFVREIDVLRAVKSKLQKSPSLGFPELIYFSVNEKQ